MRLHYGVLEGKLRSSELDLLDDAVEVLALDLGELELERGRLARAVGACERAGAPRGACDEREWSARGARRR